MLSLRNQSSCCYFGLSSFITSFHFIRIYIFIRVFQLFSNESNRRCMHRTVSVNEREIENTGSCVLCHKNCITLFSVTTQLHAHLWLFSAYLSFLLSIPQHNFWHKLKRNASVLFWFAFRRWLARSRKKKLKHYCAYTCGPVKREITNFHSKYEYHRYDWAQDIYFKE